MTAGKSRADGMKLRVFLWTGLAVTALWFSACGGGSSGGSTPPPAPTTYTIGGMVTGLSGSGLVLQDNGGDNLTVTASGSFTFTTAITSGGAYAVTVLTQPSSPTQTCTVTSGTGTATANVTSVQVACAAPTFTIGGTVSGLLGTGLVLQDNGGNNLSVTANGSFTFTTALASGTAYKVTVLTQPSGPTQTCTVTNGSGTATANVTNVQVACTSETTFTIGGTVSGLTGTGLVLQDNGGNNLTVTANGSFTFSTALTSGAAYDVTVLTQPSGPAQTCTVTDGTGTASANVTALRWPVQAKLRASGRGRVALTSPPKQAPTELKERPAQATSPGRGAALSVGQTNRETSGSLEVMVTTRPEQEVCSMTSGSIVLANGPGWAALM